VEKEEQNLLESIGPVKAQSERGYYHRLPGKSHGALGVGSPARRRSFGLSCGALIGAPRIPVIPTRRRKNSSYIQKFSEEKKGKKGGAGDKKECDNE